MSDQEIRRILIEVVIITARFGLAEAIRIINESSAGERMVRELKAAPVLEEK